MGYSFPSPLVFLPVSSVSKGHLSVAINGGELVEATEASYDEFGVYFTIDGVEYSLSSSYGEDNQIFFANSDYSFRCMLTLQA